MAAEVRASCSGGGLHQEAASAGAGRQDGGGAAEQEAAGEAGEAGQGPRPAPREGWGSMGLSAMWTPRGASPEGAARNYCVGITPWFCLALVPPCTPASRRLLTTHTSSTSSLGTCKQIVTRVSGHCSSSRKSANGSQPSCRTPSCTWRASRSETTSWKRSRGGRWPHPELSEPSSHRTCTWPKASSAWSSML